MKKLKIAGLPPISVIPDEEAESCEYLVCAPWGPSPFTDNFKGACSHCGVAVMYRWHAPRKPKRICMECVVKLEDEARNLSDVAPDVAPALNPKSKI
jgi:hypothetical protein